MPEGQVKHSTLYVTRRGWRDTNPCRTTYIYNLETRPRLFLFLHLPESRASVTDPESRNMSPSMICKPHDAVATIAYWQERSDGSRPTTNEESLIIMRQGKEVD